MNWMIKAEKRDVFGKNACRRIRKSGRIPAVLYGEGKQGLSLTLDRKDIIAILKSESGENTIFKVSFDSKTVDAMIKEIQVDPVTDQLLHADLIRISMEKALRVSVPLLLQGEPVGVKAEGGFVDFMTRELDIECLPKDIPENIKIDISGLHLHQSLKVGDIVPPPGVRIINDPSTVVVLISVPHKEEAAKPAEEVVAVEPAEPEVIRKERAEQEEEEGKEKKAKKEKE